MSPGLRIAETWKECGLYNKISPNQYIYLLVEGHIHENMNSTLHYMYIYVYILKKITNYSKICP